MSHQMDAAVQTELRKLPGNNRCVDCQAPYPQWATVSYGTFMCLECSGRHRGLGVHLSFVRSVSMDSWTPVQIRKMQLGGNDQFRQALALAGVPESGLSIAQKYNLEQATVYREGLTQLAQLVITTLPSLPRYIATTGSTAPKPNNNEMGVEALRGESERDYVTRQMRLKEEARSRMRAKFGDSNSGLQGIGSAGVPSESASSTSSLNSALSMFSTTVSSITDPEFISSVKTKSHSTASSGWNALSTGASSLWKSAQSMGLAEDHGSSAFFPRTNPHLSTQNQYGNVPTSNSDFFNAPVMTRRDEKITAPESFYDTPAPVPALLTPAPAPALITPAPAPVKKPQAPKPSKEDEDFFATFGM